MVLTAVAGMLPTILAGLAGQAAVHDTAHPHLVPHLENNRLMF